MWARHWTAALANEPSLIGEKPVPFKIFIQSPIELLINVGLYRWECILQRWAYVSNTPRIPASSWGTALKYFQEDLFEFELWMDQ